MEALKSPSFYILSKHLYNTYYQVIGSMLKFGNMKFRKQE